MRIDRLALGPLFSTSGMTRIYSVAVIIQAFHAWDRGSTLLGFTFLEISAITRRNRFLFTSRDLRQPVRSISGRKSEEMRELTFRLILGFDSSN